jgi:hypothetical protein
MVLGNENALWQGRFSSKNYEVSRSITGLRGLAFVVTPFTEPLV